jgi:hypothetical protein
MLYTIRCRRDVPKNVLNLVHTKIVQLFELVVLHVDRLIWHVQTLSLQCETISRWI